MPSTYPAMDEILVLAGLEDTDTNRQQLAIFLDAMHIFQERNAKYGDLWKEYGWRGNLLHVQSKAARVRKVWWDGKDPFGHNEDCDDAYDLINYTAFFIRNVGEDNELGTSSR